MPLSVLARLVRRNAFEEFEQGLEGTRDSALPTAMRGFTRGSLGSTGAELVSSRNPDAAEDEERDTLQSPIMRAFLGRVGRR